MDMDMDWIGLLRVLQKCRAALCEKSTLYALRGNKEEGEGGEKRGKKRGGGGLARRVGRELLAFWYRCVVCDEARYFCNIVRYCTGALWMDGLCE